MTITAPSPQTTGESSSTVTRGTALIVFASVCFGTSGPLVKPTMDAGLSPQQVASFRIALAAVLLLGFVGLTRPALLKVPRAALPLLFGYGLVGVAAVQLLYFAAVSRIPIGVAMLLEFTSPVLVALWVRFVRRVVLPPRMWVGTALTLVGLALVAEVWQGLRLDALGLLFGVGAALCAAAYFLVGGRAVGALPALGLVTWGMVIGAVVIGVIAPPWSLPGEVLGADAAFGGWQVPVWVLLVTCAVVSTAVAYLLSINSMRFLPANVVSVIAVVEPIVATVLAWLVLGQELSAAQVVGAVVLLAGATVVQLASRRPVVPGDALIPE
ncbi:EamA family transporter [Actinophytocola oryzae]|uniref:Threonine/homoserine efflux transporter RhtA n=1 Tax=Actinophytocola oryzae TaxID=502181 RepID=A0A4V3FS77_9PSEU|nr:EamA family transporter [Actinophytocola oryzae]TDV46351.1 threonine/homoserine efflux transporter RhtA [Actinophytocola oryzae]